VGLGFIKGFGLKRGAIAGSVAHDHHNIVAIGCSDGAMRAAILRVSEMGGGLCAVGGNEELLEELPLPVCGLMSDQPIEAVRDAYDRLLKASALLGSTLHDPFMAMSFMALEVIPALKLTDKGLVDVETFQIVDLFV
jgi:adenine deaminase